MTEHKTLNSVDHYLNTALVTGVCVYNLQVHCWYFRCPLLKYSTGHWCLCLQEHRWYFRWPLLKYSTGHWCLCLQENCWYFRWPLLKYSTGHRDVWSKYVSEGYVCRDVTNCDMFPLLEFNFYRDTQVWVFLTGGGVQVANIGSNSCCKAIMFEKKWTMVPYILVTVTSVFFNVGYLTKNTLPRRPSEINSQQYRPILLVFLTNLHFRGPLKISAANGVQINYFPIASKVEITYLNCVTWQDVPRSDWWLCACHDASN